MVCECVCLPVWHVCVTAYRGQKRVLNLLELTLQVVVNHFSWVLEPRLGPLEE